MNETAVLRVGTFGIIDKFRPNLLEIKGAVDGAEEMNSLNGF